MEVRTGSKNPARALPRGLELFRKLLQGDSRYAGDVARVEASLEELEKKAPSR
jgi:hypothetical protein